ncbi:cyclin-T1-3 isoform X2 [Morus notabilis]|uniref:cyclin-T1-3 isoform X2 n=1 Tax=Morus notabilis TaxID=981085 RepID=UPI000CED7E5B|nr:cyclin-T1-3 isoform X2 [Morus notabilis]
MIVLEESQFPVRKWYFSKDEIDNHSPSRKDGIDLKRESHLRKLYCSFLQEIGMKLKVPQLTIASAMMMCHQFYMRQSLAKNDWQEVFNKQKEVILVGERLVLSTIAFDLNIQLPYKLLVTALKRLDIFPNLAKVAWNFVNDWLRTTLCLQYKPHYIAAGSLFLAAKLQKVKLPKEKGRVWWQEFDISLKQLEEVIQEMHRLLGQDRKEALPSTDRPIQSKAVVQKPLEISSQSSISSSGSISNNHSSRGNLAEERGSTEYLASNCSQNLIEGVNCTTVKSVLPCRTSDSGSASTVVEEGDYEAKTMEVFSAQNNSTKIDGNRIRETLKRRKSDGVIKKLSEAMGAEMGNEAWIESEVENRIETMNRAAKKKHRCCEV